MDPNANLKEQLEIAQEIRSRMGVNNIDTADLAERLVELVLALDEWIAQGGFLPARWRKKE